MVRINLITPYKPLNTMPRTIRIKLYHFTELNERTKKRAIKSYLDRLNTKFRLWDRDGIVAPIEEQVAGYLTQYDLDFEFNQDGKMIYSPSFKKDSNLK